MQAVKFISQDIRDKITSVAKIHDVAQDFLSSMRRSGTSYLSDCPCCGGKKKFAIVPSKGLFKCHACGVGGNNAISFLIKTQGKEFVDACNYLLDRYQIYVEQTNGQPKPTKRRSRKKKFRDFQLEESGIPSGYQKYFLESGKGNGKAAYECDRYQAASVDKFWNIIPDGDDMVLNYLDLNGKPMTWKDHKGRRQNLLRVRWANPALHTDKEGKPVKYKSPYKSGSHLWIPNRIIEAYKKKEILETLYICEGEKKADKMSLHGMPAVGIMGIHNFSVGGDMPYQFELLIKECAVGNVVFVLDSDWDELKIKPDQSVDTRPYTFFKSVLKFKRYFEAYSNSGIDLNLFFAHGKDVKNKGVDDLLVKILPDNEEKLKADFEKAMRDRQGQGEYVNVYNITSESDYNIKKFWKLHSPQAFIEAHREELMKIKEFKLGNLKRRFNEEGEVELAQKLLPHETFWRKEDWETRGGNIQERYYFDYVNVRHFLRNRGFGVYEYQPEKYRFIHNENRVVKEVSHHKIQNYILEFTEEIQEKNVLELLLRGGKQYLGPEKLMNMYPMKPMFMEAQRDVQYLYFKNVYWKITADNIEERPLAELPGEIWENRILDFEPKSLGPLAKINRKNNKWSVVATKHMEKCDIAIFFTNTSNFHWRKQQEEVQENGKVTFHVRNEEEVITDEEMEMFKANLVCKMIAAGYVLHEYRDRGNLKAIICMDGEETEVGNSQGGTGKSLFSIQFEHMVPTEVVNGKKKNLADDPFLYDSVDERTQLIVFDDCRINLDFENFFSEITRGIEVNKKGERKFKLPAPKFIFNTNGAINGQGNSFKRRQYNLAFSDYYNEHRGVGEEFGRQFFYEWDWEQWNLFYNWMATCIQAFLRYGMKYTIPNDNIQRRRLRQEIGEDFISWASDMYCKEGAFLNKMVKRQIACDDFLDRYTQQKRYVNERKFKKKLIQYSEYADLNWNPTHDGGRIYSNGVEYFLLADGNFDASKVDKITEFNF